MEECLRLKACNFEDFKQLVKIIVVELGILPDYKVLNIMRTPPESFLIFKEELEKARLEKERLKKEYEAKLVDMNRELSRLKEQIQSQQELIKTTLDYAIRLEENLGSFKEEVTNGKNMKNRSFH